MPPTPSITPALNQSIQQAFAGTNIRVICGFQQHELKFDWLQGIAFPFLTQAGGTLPTCLIVGQGCKLNDHSSLGYAVSDPVCSGNIGRANLAWQHIVLERAFTFDNWDGFLVAIKSTAGS